MHEYIFILPISIFLLLGVISPGPSFILVAQTAMSKSHTEAVAVSVGMGVGAMFFAIIASLGLFVLLESVPWLYVILKWIGGIYLCFLAFKLWYSSKEPLMHTIPDNKVKKGIVKFFFVGLFTQLSKHSPPHPTS